MNYENIYLQWIMKKEKSLCAIHELWKYLFAINYEKNKCLFAIHGLWKCLFAIHDFWKHGQCPFETHELWKNENIVCNHELWKQGNIIFAIHYEHFYLQYMNYERYEMFVRNHELWKYLFAIPWIMKKENICIHELWKH